MCAQQSSNFENPMPRYARPSSQDVDSLRVPAETKELLKRLLALTDRSVHVSRSDSSKVRPVWTFTLSPRFRECQVAVALNGEKVSLYVKSKSPLGLDIRDELSNVVKIEQQYPNPAARKPPSFFGIQGVAPNLQPDPNNPLLRISPRPGHALAALNIVLGSSGTSSAVTRQHANPAAEDMVVSNGGNESTTPANTNLDLRHEDRQTKLNGDGRKESFIKNRQYTRAEIRRILGVKGTKGGKWDTGHVSHNGEHYVFCNIAISGRTGHNYDNRFDGDDLIWHPRNSATLAQPVFARLVSGDEPVQVFFRSADHDPFTYAGRGQPVLERNEPPIEVRWRFPDDKSFPEDIADLSGVIEGAKRQITVNAYERDPTAKPRCIKKWGTICVVCDFDFSAVYGELGEGFIHVHHLTPIHTVGKAYELNPEEDLRPVCPNCHAILHRRKLTLSIEELRQRLNLRFSAAFHR